MESNWGMVEAVCRMMRAFPDPLARVSPYACEFLANLARNAGLCCAAAVVPWCL